MSISVPSSSRYVFVGLFDTPPTRCVTAIKYAIRYLASGPYGITSRCNNTHLLNNNKNKRNKIHGSSKHARDCASLIHPGVTDQGAYMPKGRSMPV